MQHKTSSTTVNSSVKTEWYTTWHQSLRRVEDLIHIINPDIAPNITNRTTRPVHTKWDIQDPNDCNHYTHIILEEVPVPYSPFETPQRSELYQDSVVLPRQPDLSKKGMGEPKDSDTPFPIGGMGPYDPLL